MDRPGAVTTDQDDVHRPDAADAAVLLRGILDLGTAERLDYVQKALTDAFDRGQLSVILR